MERFCENLVRSRPSRLWSLATKGLALLWVLRQLLVRRLRREHRRRPETQHSCATVQELIRLGMGGGLFRHSRAGCTFAGAQTFQDLFQQLDAKRVLWGSQKQYRATELKVLINRVRTKNPQLHLPLEVIPDTGGLRQQVQVLAAAEAWADDPNNYRHAA
jgi:hypothetical protein